MGEGPAQLSIPGTHLPEEDLSLIVHPWKPNGPKLFIPTPLKLKIWKRYGS